MIEKIWHFHIDGEDYILKRGSKWALTIRPGEGPFIVAAVDPGNTPREDQGTYLIELQYRDAEKNYCVGNSYIHARAFFNGVATPWPEDAEVTSDKPNLMEHSNPNPKAQFSRPPDFLDQFLATAPIDQAIGALRYLVLSNMALGNMHGETYAKLYLDRLNEYRQSKGLTY